VVAAIADELGLVAKLTSDEEDERAAQDGARAKAGSTPATPTAPASTAGLTAPTSASRPTIEVVRAVRERLWLADELDVPAGEADRSAGQTGKVGRRDRHLPFD
jgi:hypothetical protein